MEPWHLIGHLAIALLISFFIYRKTKEKYLILIIVLASFLIDVDHLFDFWMAYGFTFNLLKFFEIDFFTVNGKVFVPFHSWELVALILLLSKFVKKYSWFLLSLGLAMFGHILWDMVSYKIKPVDYLLFWRVINGFKMSCGW